MLFLRTALLAAAAVSIAGCQAEMQHPGGLVGAAADKGIFPAESKEMQAYRGLVVGAALARMAERNAVTSAAAVTAVNAMNSVTATTSRLQELAVSDCYTSGQVAASWREAPAKDLKDAGPAAAEQCYRNAYSVLFEAKVPDLHESLYYLASAALPPDRFGDIASSLVAGNYLATLWSLLLAARDVAGTLHYGLSVGRSATEQRAIVSNNNKLPEKNPFDVRVAVEILSVDGAVLKASRGKPDTTAFYAMFALIKESCFRVQRRIASTGGPSEVKCIETFGQQPELTRTVNGKERKGGYNDGLNPGGQD
jgi:hypothetical protein